MGETVVVIILNVMGCGPHPDLELSACWVRRDAQEWRFAEIGQEQSRNWAALWKRWVAWLRHGDPSGRIEVAVHPDVSTDRKHRLDHLIAQTRGVMQVEWHPHMEDLMVYAMIGRRGP